MKTTRKAVQSSFEKKHLSIHIWPLFVINDELEIVRIFAYRYNDSDTMVTNGGFCFFSINVVISYF